MLMSDTVYYPEETAIPPNILTKSTANLTKPTAKRAKSGQSLVEFVLVAPILVLVMIAGAMLGYGTFQAHMASNAAQQAALNKLKYADSSAAVGSGTIQGDMNGGNLSSSMTTGDKIDSVQVVDADPYTSIMVATRNYQASVNFIPSFNIKVGQVMNRNLLQSANAGGAIVHSTAAWVPGGAPVAPTAPATPPTPPPTNGGSAGPPVTTP
jgi:hypothetical protein